MRARSQLRSIYRGVRSLAPMRLRPRRRPARGLLRPPAILVLLLAVGIIGLALSARSGGVGTFDLRGVARVIDGDTLAIGPTTVRLTGIDAPERDQTCADKYGLTRTCGQAAAEALTRLANSRLVACRTRGQDVYGRSLGTCYADGKNLNAWMVRHGHAWAFTRYSLRYVPEEWLAWSEGAGIWSGPAQPAWQHRASR
jgi:endonuclease YncB( thermonuclease family)